MILVTARFFKKNILAMAIFPFILLRDKQLKTNQRLINHERIHLRQQIELAVILFYVWYIVEYVIRLLRMRDADAAYRNISFEREAYAHDGDLQYLQNRQWYAFINYL